MRVLAEKEVLVDHAIHRLRPILMVFGMVGAILLAHPAAGFISATFMIAMAGAMSGDSITGILGFMAYILIYCIAMTTMLHGIFSLVHYIPDNVPRWIGHAIGIQGASDIRDEEKSSGAFYAAMSTVQANTGAKRKKNDPPPTSDGDQPGGGAAARGSTASRGSEDQRQRGLQGD